uniref:Putative ovule protein n=1 Tax=Solanum chacoense TaxID=4108 RepID=A0A0V0GYN8_SOLCH
MSGGTHSENMTNSVRHSGELRQPDLVESVVEMPDLTILSPRLAQVIDATVTNGTVLDSPRIEIEAEPIKDPPASNWTNLFAKNKVATNGLNLEYIPLRW